MFEAKIDKGKTYIRFEVRTDKPLSVEEAKDFQGKKGYLVMGYGFNEFECVEMPSGRFKTTWNCYASCD